MDQEVGRVVIRRRLQRTDKSRPVRGTRTRRLPAARHRCDEYATRVALCHNFIWFVAKVHVCSLRVKSSSSHLTIVTWCSASLHMVKGEFRSPAQSKPLNQSPTNWQCWLPPRDNCWTNGFCVCLCLAIFTYWSLHFWFTCALLLNTNQLFGHLIQLATSMPLNQFSVALLNACQPLETCHTMIVWDIWI